jgi:hypothetical protein
MTCQHLGITSIVPLNKLFKGASYSTFADYTGENDRVYLFFITKKMRVLTVSDIGVYGGTLPYELSDASSYQHLLMVVSVIMQ